MFERQTDQPLYPKILWNRPVSRSAGGRLLVIGGHSGNLAQLQAIYQVANAAGIGALSLIVPDTLRSKLAAIPEIDFAPSTISGSLAKAALAQIIEAASYADATLIGPNLSNNSETAIMMEQFIHKYRQPLILADDGLELIHLLPDEIAHRPGTLIILTMQQLFRLAGKLELPVRIAPEAGLMAKVEIVNDLYRIIKTDLALIGPDLIIKTADQTSVTPCSQNPNLEAAALGILSVFYTQNPNARYQGLTTGAFLVKGALAAAANPTIAEICASLAKTLDRLED